MKGGNPGKGGTGADNGEVEVAETFPPMDKKNFNVFFLSFMKFGHNSK